MAQRSTRRSVGGRVLALAFALGSSAALLAACANTRDLATVPPYFDRDVRPIFAAKCASCHGGAEPAGGYSVTSYVGAIACNEAGAPVVLPMDATAPLLAALDLADHATLLTLEEREIVTRWVVAGAPARRAGVHPPGMIDPRSPDWHGKLLRDGSFARMLDGTLPDACSNCHRGTPSARNPALAPLTAPPPAATPCTSCHREPGGVLACGTCHGDGAARATPPRDLCLFPGGPTAGAHTAHVGGSAIRPEGFACTTCHAPVDAAALFSGTHVNGTVNVEIDETLAGSTAAYDPVAHTCANVACHSRGGARATPDWTTMGPLGCSDCHTSPPADHYPYVCSKCHPGVNDLGDGLDSATLHVNGQVDVGRDGTGRCGTCHGAGGDDPWPLTGAHPAHASPTLSAPIACASCHAVPESVDSSGHLDSTVGAEVTFSMTSLARARGAAPDYDPVTRTCTNVACHGAGTWIDPATGHDYRPTWRTAGPGEARCGSCHAAPPPPPHTLDTTCSAAICHGSEIAIWPDGPRISDAGRARHIDGTIVVGTP